MILEEFEDSEFRRVLISIATGKIDVAIKELIENKDISIKELKEVFLCLLQKREVETLDWFSNKENEDLKITTIAELCRLAYATELGKITNSINEPTEKIAYDLICNYGIEIEEEAGDYPNESISGLVWMDGAAVTEWAYFMAEYFNRKLDKERELQMLFIRAKVTNSVMSHYHHLVGPAMVDLGFSCLENNLPEKAEEFFNAVILDFEWLIEEYINSKTRPENEDSVALDSLKKAYEGMLRIRKDKGIKSKLNDIDRLNLHENA